MIKTISPIILTSKPAQKHLDKIRVEHSTILDSIQNHQMMNEQFNREETANKQIEENQNFQRETNDKKMSADNEKGKIEAETRRLSEINKQKELAIKEQALNTE